MALIFLAQYNTNQDSVLIFDKTGVAGLLATFLYQQKAASSDLNLINLLIR